MLVKECKKYEMHLIDTKDGKDRDKVLNDLLLKIVND